MEFWLTRGSVIGLAVGGAVLAMMGSWLKSRDSNNLGRWLYWAGYLCTGVSMLLFVIIGFRGLRE